jgi:hypothetical protein
VCSECSLGANMRNERRMFELEMPGDLLKAAQGGLDKSGEVARMGVESVLEKDELSKRLAPPTQVPGTQSPGGFQIDAG